MRQLLQRAAIGVLLLSPLGQGAVSAQERHSLFGLVRDTARVPIAGVEVLLMSPRRSTLTDAAGRFQFDSVPAGTRQLLIRRIGYLPVRPTVRVPQADTLRAVLVQLAYMLPPVIVETELPGIRGVVGDTGRHALPGTIVELLGAGRADTTDELGRFAFEGLKQGQYMLRLSLMGFQGRLFSVLLGRPGQEYSILLDQYRRGAPDWTNGREAAVALPHLAKRLAMEPSRYRMTRAELERYGTTALCDIARLRFRGGEPTILLRGTNWIKNASLCAWSADELDLVEWGENPCREAAKTIAEALNVYCGPANRVSSLSGRAPAARVGWVAIWPRG